MKRTRKMAMNEISRSYEGPKGIKPLMPPWHKEPPSACETAINALHAAHTDIGHWCQLATRQYAEMPNASHNPIAPTLAGIEASRKVQRQLMEAVKILRDNHEQEKETSEKPRRTTTQG